MSLSKQRLPRRLGKFQISDSLLNLANIECLQSILRSCTFIAKAEHLWDSRTFRYTAISDIFKEIPEEQGPWYYGLALTQYVCLDGTVFVFDGFMTNGLDHTRLCRIDHSVHRVLTDKMIKTEYGPAFLLGPSEDEPDEWLDILLFNGTGKNVRISADLTIVPLHSAPHLNPETHKQ